jgi:hypothetical protein
MGPRHLRRTGVPRSRSQSRTLGFAPSSDERGGPTGGTLQAAVAEEYLRDPERLVSDTMYFAWGVGVGTVPIWIAMLGHVSIGWIAFGLLLSVFSFGAGGARAVYGKARLRSVGAFYADIIRLR